MTDQATRVVPAGWYEDPASPAHVRWWNGLAWTEHTALKPTAPPSAQPTAQEQAAQQPTYLQTYAQQGSGGNGTATTSTGSIHTPETLARIAEARELERHYGIGAGEHELVARPAAEGAQVAPGHAGDDEPRTQAPRSAYDTPVDGYDDEERTTTASAWFIALWPVLTLVAAVVAAYVAFYVAPEPSVGGIPLVAVLVIVPLLLTLAWAATDARKLRQRGHRPPSAAFALLGPLVYLIARRTRVRGTGPLVTLLLLTLAVVGGSVAAYLTGAAAPVTKAVEIQQELRAQLVETGRLASVSCPIFVESLAAGSIYECEGTLPDGGSKLVWVGIETATGEFSYALDVR